FLAFSYVLFIRPKHQLTESLIQENVVNQQLLFNQQQKKLDTLKIITDIYSKVSEEDLLKFNAVLPYQYKQEQLFGEFEEIANKNGWILKTVSLSYPDELEPGQVPTTISNEDFFAGSLNPNVGRIEVNLNLAGLDYQAVKKLLAVMEENLRLFDVNQITFSGASELNLNLTTYYYKANN
ncbi:hypothetical protein JXK06_01645, partial [Patescibacteria group bacterium]|nr:hypothetical protein [Patescibacteria group bacterium]